MQCRKVLHHLDAHVAGDLADVPRGGALAAQIDAHLGRCFDCARVFAEAVEARDALAELRRPLTLSDEMFATMREEIVAETARWHELSGGWGRRQPLTAWVRWGLAAACLFMGGLSFGMWGLGQWAQSPGGPAAMSELRWVHPFTLHPQQLPLGSTNALPVSFTGRGRAAGEGQGEVGGEVEGEVVDDVASSELVYRLWSWSAEGRELPAELMDAVSLDVEPARNGNEAGDVPAVEQRSKGPRQILR